MPGEKTAAIAALLPLITKLEQYVNGVSDQSVVSVKQ